MLQARHRLASCLCLVAAAASPARAEEPSPPLESIPVVALPERQPAPAPELAAVQLEVVVVKGEKLGRKLSETTTSVSVFNGKNIEDQGDGSVSELLRRAANTTTSEEGNISIRGVSQSGAGSSYGGSNSPLISMQVDGVTLDRTSQQGAADDLFDVDQVEVLRGAQSTSQGRNALAGAVVVNTREPTRQWDVRSRVIFGQRDQREYALAAGGPLSQAFAFRLVGSFENDDGFITHLPDGNRDFARSQKTLVRAKLAFKPQGWQAFDSLLTVGLNRSNSQPDYNQEAGEAGSDPAKRRTSTVNVPTGDLSRGGLASWRNRLRLGEGVMLTALTAHVRAHQDYLRDYDGLAEDGGTNDGFTHGNNITQELRLNLKDLGRFTGVVGLYGGRFKDDTVFFTKNIFVNADEVNLPSVPVAGDVLGVELDYFNRIDRDARNFAGFTEFDIKLPWNLTATLGLRYDRERLDTINEAQTTRGDAVVDSPSGAVQVPLAGEALDDIAAQLPGINVLPALLLAPNLVPNTNGPQRGRTSYSALLPKAGLRWAITPQWSVFATYSEAYRAGGVDVDSTNGQSLPYDPEYTQNYELGARGDYKLLDFAVNAFYTDWRDQQVPVLRGQFFVTQNAANSRLYGGETSLGWRPAKSLRLQVAAGFTDTKFVDYRVGTLDYSGNRFIFAPRVSGSLGAVWRHGGWMAAGNYSQRSKGFSTPANRPSERSEARQLLDGRVGYEQGFFRAYLFGKNLLNDDKVTETYQFTTGYPGAGSPRGYAAYSAPRTLGMQFEARF